MTNNLAGGVVYAGFVGGIGHKCGDYSSNNFKDNIAHSVIGTKSGAGAFIKSMLSDSSQAKCFEFSHFKAYKTYYTPAFTYDDKDHIIMSKMTFIDNRVGFSAHRSGGEYSDSLIEFKEIKVYGESPLPDCPQDRQGGFCHKYHKSAIMAAACTTAGKPLHIAAMSPLPPQKIKSIGNWLCRVHYNNIEFRNFRSKTR